MIESFLWGLGSAALIIIVAVVFRIKYGQQPMYYVETKEKKGK